METLERRKEIISEEVENAIKSGVPVANMNIFEQINSLKIRDNVKGTVEYVTEQYIEFVEKFKKLEQPLQEAFLTTLKKADIIDNQKLEKEDPFMIAFYRNFTNEYAIDIMIKHYGKELTKDILINIHDQLLKGTTSEDKIGLRNDNSKFVGSIIDGKRIISYLPILDKDIDLALMTFLQYFNDKNYNDDSEIITKPIIYHGILSALQLFKDGNTRLSRLIQNVEIWGNMNKTYECNLSLPLVYATRQYSPFRDQYRQLVKNLVVNNNDDAWNEWILFNLNRIVDGLYFDEQKLNQIQKKNIKTF